MMETYAELLKRKEKMADYNKDMQDRQREKERLEKIRQEEDIDYRGGSAINLEIPDDMFVKLAVAAHEKDITLNKYIALTLKKSLRDSDYQYEHPNKRQILKEY